jgi:regulator of replication initiation timing
MKNKYEISQNYLLNLENDELRQRIKKLIADYKELKQMYDEKNNGTEEGMVQDQRCNPIFQE